MIFVAVAIAVFVFAIVLSVQNAHARQFRYDERNPYRRFCRICDQQQDEYGIEYNDRPGWWENISPIKNPKCSCHEYTK